MLQGRAFEAADRFGRVQRRSRRPERSKFDVQHDFSALGGIGSKEQFSQITRGSTLSTVTTGLQLLVIVWVGRARLRIERGLGLNGPRCDACGMGEPHLVD